MAFEIPSIGEVVRTVENGFSTAFYGSAGVLRVTVLKLLAKVIGAAVYLPLLACKYIWKNSFVSAADAEGLVKIGSDYALPHKPASYAHGAVTVMASAGTRIAAGTVFVYENSGKEYELLQEIVVSSMIASGEIRAVEPGNESNLGSASVNLVFRDGEREGVSYVTANGVDGGRIELVQVGSAVEQWGETAEEYRERLKFRKRNQPQGGCGADYVGWCMRFEFVTKVYKFENWPATNNVALFLVNANNESFVPFAGDIETVQDYVNDESRKPLTSAPLVIAATPVNVTLDLAFSRLSGAVQSAVTTAIKNYLREFGPGKTVEKTDIYNVAASAAGDPLCSVTGMTKNGVTAGSIALAKRTGGTPVGEVVNLNSLVINFSQV